VITVLDAIARWIAILSGREAVDVDAMRPAVAKV
jgi:hypothetical protein